MSTPFSKPFLKFARCAMAAALVTFVVAGCNNGTNNDVNYRTAVNDHFKAFPACIWSQPKKFPVQAATSDDAKTAGYDAMTQAGLLVRTVTEKKIIIVSKQENNYDLSDAGRTSWVPDSSQPGYGNFCYGNREVTSIDNSTLGTNSAREKTVDVAYHYKLSNVPTWANDGQMRTAFPDMAAAITTNPSDRATLVMTGDRWEYQR
jgi:hypothetical protein